MHFNQNSVFWKVYITTNHFFVEMTVVFGRKHEEFLLPSTIACTGLQGTKKEVFCARMWYKLGHCTGLKIQPLNIAKNSIVGKNRLNGQYPK